MTTMIIFTTSHGTKIILDEASQTATFLCVDRSATVSLQKLVELLSS